MHRLALVFASLVLALGLFTWVAPATPVAAQDGGYAPDGEEAAFVDLLNDYRASLGLNPVSINYQLGAAADYHSYDMATNNYFDHFLFDGTDPGTNIRNFGYYGSPYGENIAAGMETAQEVLIAWQNSPGHNAELTKPEFTEVGIGRYYGESSYYGWYWTADFGGGGDAGAPAPVETAPVEAAPVEAAPVEEAPAEVAANEPDPLISGDSSVTGNATTDGSTTTYQEPPTVITDDGALELQQQVDADGDRAVSNGANPVANGEGETVIYGDINTGGIQGESIVYEPPSLSVDGSGPAPAPATAPIYTDSAPVETAPVPAEPVYTDPTMSETVTTNISMEDGNGRAIG